MSEQNENSYNSIIQLLVWCVAAPILSIWMLVSFLPMVSVIRAWGDVADVLVALGFLGSGALGLIAAFIGYRLLLWRNASAPVTSPATRALRAAALSAYAVVWMALYAI